MGLEFSQLLPVERTESVDLALRQPVFMFRGHYAPRFLISREDAEYLSAFGSLLSLKAPPIVPLSRFASSHQNRRVPAPCAVILEDSLTRCSSLSELRSALPMIQQSNSIRRALDHR